jgi:hypothetical protein
MDEWQSIETAPKDGRALLLFVPVLSDPLEPSVIITAAWEENRGWLDNGMTKCQIFGHPTHWKALPEPPKGQQ